MEQKLIITKRPNLTKAQKPLFNLLCDKIYKGEKLTLPEVKKIYIENACRNFVDGQPATYNWCYKLLREPKWDKKGKQIQSADWQGKYEKMNKELVNFTVLQWFTHNLGALVLKGYLKVLPVMELN